MYRGKNNHPKNHFVLFVSYVKQNLTAKTIKSLSKYKDKIQLSSDSTLIPQFNMGQEIDLQHIETIGKKVFIVTNKGFHMYSAGNSASGVAGSHRFETFENAPGRPCLPRPAELEILRKPPHRILRSFSSRGSGPGTYRRPSYFPGWLSHELLGGKRL